MAAKPNKKKQKPPTRAIPHNSTIRKFRIVEFSLTIAAGWMVKVYPLRETSSETCFTRRNSHVPSARWTMLPDPFVRRLPLAAMMFLPVGSAFGHLPQGPPKGTLLALYPGHKRPDTWQKRPFPSNRKTAESARVRRPETLGFRRFAGVHPLLAHVELVFHHSSISNGFHGMACLKWWLFMVAYSMLIAWLQYLKPRITGMNNTV